VINSVAFATFEPGLAASQIRNSPDNWLGIVGQSTQRYQLSTPLVALAVVIGVLLLVEHLRIKG
jgi:hypothetical protein